MNYLLFRDRTRDWTLDSTGIREFPEDKTPFYQCTFSATYLIVLERGLKP